MRYFTLATSGIEMIFYSPLFYPIIQINDSIKSKLHKRQQNLKLIKKTQVKYELFKSILLGDSIPLEIVLIIFHLILQETENLPQSLSLLGYTDSFDDMLKQSLLTMDIFVDLTVNEQEINRRITGWNLTFKGCECFEVDYHQFGKYCKMIKNMGIRFNSISIGPNICNYSMNKVQTYYNYYKQLENLIESTNDLNIEASSFTLIETISSATTFWLRKIHTLKIYKFFLNQNILSKLPNLKHLIIDTHELLDASTVQCLNRLLNYELIELDSLTLEYYMLSLKFRNSMNEFCELIQKYLEHHPLIDLKFIGNRSPMSYNELRSYTTLINWSTISDEFKSIVDCFQAMPLTTPYSNMDWILNFQRLTELILTDISYTTLENTATSEPIIIKSNSIKKLSINNSDPDHNTSLGSPIIFEFSEMCRLKELCFIDVYIDSKTFDYLPNSLKMIHFKCCNIKGVIQDLPDNLNTISFSFQTEAKFADIEHSLLISATSKLIQAPTHQHMQQLLQSPIFLKFYSSDAFNETNLTMIANLSNLVRSLYFEFQPTSMTLESTTPTPIYIKIDSTTATEFLITYPEIDTENIYTTKILGIKLWPVLNFSTTTCGDIMKDLSMAVIKSFRSFNININTTIENMNTEGYLDRLTSHLKGDTYLYEIEEIYSGCPVKMDE